MEFNRDGRPKRGYIVGRLENGHRFVANEEDEGTLMQLASGAKEPVGRMGFVRNGGGGRNLFVFSESGKL